jgi:hypothetical protein
MKSARLDQGLEQTNATVELNAASFDGLDDLITEIVDRITANHNEIVVVDEI